MPKVIISTSSKPNYDNWGNNTELEQWEARNESDISSDNSSSLAMSIRNQQAVLENQIKVSPPTADEWSTWEEETPRAPSPIQPSWAKIKRWNLNWVKPYKSAINKKFRIRNWTNGVFTSDPIQLWASGGVTIQNGKSAYIVRKFRGRVQDPWSEQGLGWQTKFDKYETFSMYEDVTVSTPIYTALNQTEIRNGIAGIPSSHNESVSSKSDIALTSVTSASQQAMYDLATSLAEAPSSLRTLSSVINGSSSGVLRYKAAIGKIPTRYLGRGGYQRFLREAGAISSEMKKHVSEAWLAYRYGIMPIIYDAQALGNAIRHVYNVEKGHAGESVESTETKTQGLFTGSTRFRTSIKASYRGIYSTGGKRVQMHLPTTLVELVPFSVVINWFANIKNFVGSMRVIPGANIVYSISIQNEYNATVERQASRHRGHHANLSGEFVYFGGPAYSESWRSQERNEAAPTSKLGIDVNMSSWRIVDAIAISLSRFF